METNTIMYLILVFIVIALIPKIVEDFKKGIAEGNEKKRQKDLIKEVNDSNHPNNKVCCRFCVHWKPNAVNHYQCFNRQSLSCLMETDADFHCNMFGSIEETTGNNSGSTGEASRKH